METIEKGGETLVTVLVAVYNGEKYLQDQLDSILNQTIKDIKILIRDDGSTDNSKEIIKEYKRNFPNIINTVSGDPTKSACGNFAQLLYKADSDYIMFCDQDDVWKKDKIEITLNAMLGLEKDFSGPVLVHSDLTVTDGNLSPVSDSFFEYQGLAKAEDRLCRLLVQNCVTGCTVMINRALKEKCGEVPEECAMHDWWLALVACLFGKIGFIETPLIFYRQHENNQVGAKSAKGIGFIKRKLKDIDKLRKNYDTTYIQASILRERYADSISQEDLEIIDAYCRIPSLSKFKKIAVMRKYGFYKSTRLRVIGQYIFI